MSSQGSLILVATPIGNIGDISKRAKAALEDASAIACEDTRVTGKLLQLLELGKKPLIPYHDNNERETATQLADRIESGETVALVSDAGTPAVSDPGFRAVRECRKRGLKVTTTPGPCAAVAALSVSGLPSDGFLFAGFLPPKTAARKRFFERYSDFEYSIVVYESCHRIGKFMDDLVDALGPGRTVCVAREITKLHETIHSGPAGEVREAVAKGSGKGEFVVVIAKPGFAY